MQFYPQLLLWTYVLLPAISLLLSPTFFIALARAQQQRARIMTNALAARGRAAAALARANQRRYLPRYSNGLAQFKPFKMRSKRELDMDVPEIGIDEKPREASMLERKSHWDQQEESLGQLENMWNMNNFGISQNEGVRSMHDQRPEELTEETVGDPFMHGARNGNRNNGQSDYYAGAFSGRNVFDGVLEQSQHVSSIQGESELSNADESVGNPDPTFKKLKKKLNKKQEPHQQNYYNYYYPQSSHGGSYGYPYGRSDETEDLFKNRVMEIEHRPEDVIGDPSNPDESVGDPDPTFKKLKKKLNKKQEPHQQNYYNYYYPQSSHGGSYGYPYGRSDGTEGHPENGVMGTEDTPEDVISDPSNPDESVGDPDPTFKKLKKKLNKKQESHEQNYYNYYYPQSSHGGSYGYPYGRSDETEGLPQNGVMGTEHTLEDITGNPLNADEQVGDPDPTFKKLKKKLNKKQEPPQRNYYNYYYYPQSSHGGSYGYPYGRSDETEDLFKNRVMEIEHRPEDVIGDPSNPDESVGDPDPTFKKLKKKLNKKQEPHQQNYYNYYYPQSSHGGSYGYLYGRSDETEGLPQNEEMGTEHTLEDITGNPLNADEQVGDPDPTFKKLKKKLNKKQEPPQRNYYNYYYYPQSSHGGSYGYPYGRSDETEAVLEKHFENEIMETEDTSEDDIGGPSNSDEKVGNPDPTFKKLKKKLNKKQEPHQQNYYNYYYYPQNSHGSSYGYPYGRSHAVEVMPQNEAMETEHRPEAINDSSNTEDVVGNPEPTFKKLKKLKKLGEEEEHQPYPYPQNYHNSYYPQYSYPSYYRNAETEDMHQNGAIIDDMAMNSGHQSFHVTEPKLGDPEPHYNPYSRASQRGKMLQNMEEHQMDNFMMGELMLPRFAHPEPTFKDKKKTTTTIEHMPPSFYYPQNQYDSYYSPSSYSDAYNNPYRSAEMVAQNEEAKSLHERVGDVNPFEEEEKSANPEPHHSHKKIERTHSGGEKNFFYSSNFYERDNEPVVEDTASEANISKQQEVQKGTDEPKIVPVENNLNSPKASEHSPTSQEGEHGTGTEDVGCELDEKIEKKLEKKLKKLLKKDKEEPTTNKMEHPYPPMHPPMNPPMKPPMYPPTPSYEDEYEEPEYYRSASESEANKKNNKQTVKSQTIMETLKDEKKTENKNEDNYPSLNPPSSHHDQPGSHRYAPNAGKSEKDNNQQVKNVDEPIVAPKIYQHISMPFKEFPDNTQEPQEEFHVFEERFASKSDNNDRPINVAPQTMENSRSASYMTHVHDNPEDVGCELDDNLLDPDNAMKSFDPYNFYQRTVEEISEESRNIAEKAKKLLQPQNPTPAMIKPAEPAIAYVDFDELPKHDYQANENPHSDIILDFDRIEPSREKSADPSANPHLSHNHGSTHTHTHFISHTHGHDHQKGLSKLHGGQGVHPINSHVFPHHQGLSNSGFSQANANAQAFNHGGHHSSIAHANSKTFGNGFGSNAAIAQSQAQAQAFNGGQINNFGLNSQAGAESFHNGGQFNDFIQNRAIAQSGAQGFTNGGFGQSAASAGSLIQNGQHLAPNAANAQSQALTNGVFGQSAASANSHIQNGQTFAPNAAFAQSQAHNNGGFGQSAAHASAQSGLGGNIGPQNFQHGFRNAEGLAFNNNPGQFASNLPNAQILGQRHEKELFVMPHLQELPVKHLFTEMKSGTHRLSRSPKDFEDVFGGLRLASGIVDASLDRNGALDGTGQQRSSDAPEDMLGRSPQDDVFGGLRLASGIVDASLDRNGALDGTGQQRSSDAPQDMQGRSPQDDVFGGLRLASGIVDASLDRNGALDGTGQQRSSDGAQDMPGTMGYVSHIVGSGIRAGESNTQRGNIFGIHSPRYHEPQSARDLAMEGISSITDIVSKGLRVKRQDGFEGLRLASGIVDASLDRNGALGGTGRQRSSDAHQDMQGRSPQDDVFGGLRLASGIVDASLDRNGALDGTGQQRSSDAHQDMQGRSPQDDVFGGLRLASGIVDASLDRNSASDGTGKQRSSDGAQDMPGTMGYVSHIVDSGIRAGESNTQRGNIFGTHFPRYHEPQSARGLAMDGISSITDIVSKGLRVKRQDGFEGLRLASGIVDSSLNKNSFLDGTGEQRSSDETKDVHDTMSYAKDIVNSSIMDRESNPQKSTSSKTNFLESQSASAGLVGKEVSAITDLVSKGLGVKHQFVSENKNNFEELPKDTDEDKVLINQSTDHVLQKSDETGNSDNLSLAVNEKADNHTNTGRAPINEKNEAENTDIDSPGQEKMVLGMVDPDTVSSTPETITNQPETSERNHNHKTVIYVTPVATDVPSDNDSSTLKINNTSRNLEENNFNDENPITSSENLGVIAPVHKQLENTFEGLQNGKEVLLTNPTTEKSLELITQSTEYDKEVITDFTKKPINLHSTMDDLKKDEISANTANSGSFLGVSNEGSVVTSLEETNKDTSGNNQDNINIEDRKLIRDEEASLANTAELLPHFLFANGTRKNISDLTSDEIQELQFDLPNNSTEGNIYINPDSKSTTGEIIGIPLITDKHFNAKLDDNTTESNKNDEDINLPKMSKENISKANQENSSHISKIPVSQHQKDSIKKIIFDMSEGPFASIEAEMGVLTEEEKEAFIKQEVALIQEVIEETFRKHNVDDPNVNRNSETSKNKTSDVKEASESTEKVVTSPNLFQALGRDSGRAEYSRQAQPNTNEKKFNDILGEHREKVEKIKNIAADEDEDLLMISYIGDSVVKDLETRRNNSDEVNQTNHSLTNQFNHTNNEAIEINQINPINVTYYIGQIDTLNHTTARNVTDDAKKVDELPLDRTKREISGMRSSRTPLTQLISDPTTKLDVEKTLQNLGSIARHTFENPRAPMYHVRNMLGNAKNSVMSAASVPPNNFLIPSKYSKIARNKELNGEKVGAVNQNMLISRSGFGNTDSGEDGDDSERNFNGNLVGLEDTVQKLGGMVRESVQRGKDAVEHVNNVAADAKKFLETSKNTVPRLIVPRPQPKLASRASFDPAVGSVLRSKPTLRKKTWIAPKILDLQENIIGTAQENPENFVGVGHMLDAVGLSQPNQPEVELQKIVYEPYNMNLRSLTIPSKSITEKAKKPPKKYDVKKEGKDQNAVLGAKQAPVTENLRDFMQRMHDEMKEIVRSQYEDRKRQRLQRTMRPRTKPLNKNKTDFNDFKKTTRQTILQNQKSNPNILGATNSYYKTRKNLEETEDMAISPEVFSQIPHNGDNGEGVENKLNVPVVLSRIQAKTKYELPSTSYAGKYPYHEQYLTNDNSGNNEEEKVQLFLPENLMKPFMGQPSESEIQEYMRLNGDEETFERERSDVSKKTPEISDITKLINLQNSPLAKVDPLSPISYVGSIVPMKRKSPKVPLGLAELSKIKPFSPADHESSFLTPELVGAVMPQAISDKVTTTASPEIAEKTKEFVELLSDPEIEDSELPEANQNGSSSSLDSNMQNAVIEPESTSNTPNIESDFLQKPVANSLDKTNKNAVDANTGIYTVKNRQEKTLQNVENVRHTPSSNLKLQKSFTVGPVPDQNDLGYVLGAINPMMFERHFNERLQINDTSSQDTHNALLNQGVIRNENDASITKTNTGRPTVPGKNNQSPIKPDETKEDLDTTKEQQLNDIYQIQGGNQQEKDVEEQVQKQQKNDEQISENENDLNELDPEGGRTSMNVLDPYKKPFMGYIEKDKMNKFLNQYNNNLSEENDNEQHEEHDQNESYKQNIEPVKNVVFSSLDGEDDYNNDGY